MTAAGGECWHLQDQSNFKTLTCSEDYSRVQFESQPKDILAGSIKVNIFWISS